VSSEAFEMVVLALGTTSEVIASLNEAKPKISRAAAATVPYNISDLELLLDGCSRLALLDRIGEHSFAAGLPDSEVT
jgi:hypothetical protein